jgi:hypothetical protein
MAVEPYGSFRVMRLDVPSKCFLSEKWHLTRVVADPATPEGQRGVERQSKFCQRGCRAQTAGSAKLIVGQQKRDAFERIQMEVRICPYCDEHNISVAWKCKKCNHDISSISTRNIEGANSEFSFSQITLETKDRKVNETKKYVPANKSINRKTRIRQAVVIGAITLLIYCAIAVSSILYSKLNISHSIFPLWMFLGPGIYLVFLIENLDSDFLANSLLVAVNGACWLGAGALIGYYSKSIRNGFVRFLQFGIVILVVYIIGLINFYTNFPPY